MKIKIIYNNKSEAESRMWFYCCCAAVFRSWSAFCCQKQWNLFYAYATVPLVLFIRRSHNFVVVILLLCIQLIHPLPSNYQHFSVMKIYGRFLWWHFSIKNLLFAFSLWLSISLCICHLLVIWNLNIVLVYPDRCRALCRQRVHFYIYQLSHYEIISSGKISICVFVSRILLAAWTVANGEYGVRVCVCVSLLWKATQSSKESNYFK